MKKLIVLLCFALAVAGMFLYVAPVARAITQPVVDKEFIPGFNYYGRENSVFISACTRFTPSRSSYTNYFDLAVKNDQGSGYPIRASVRTAISPDIPNTAKIKTYHQTTFNNYAMQQGMSTFVSDDSEMISLTIGANYFICIDDLANNNATGWFYTNPASGGYSILGYDGDVQTPFAGTFGYRTYAFEPATPPDGGGGNTPGQVGSNTNQAVTTGNSPIAQGGAPSSNISSAIAKPGDLTADSASEKLGAVLKWAASTTTTIGGYNIYRSISSGKDYAKIGDTAKDVVTFTDSTVTAGTTYYYMVRAYKGNAESANSNEASLAPRVTTDPSGQDALRPIATYTAFELTPLLWGLVGTAVLLLGVLILIVIRRKRKVKAVAAQQSIS